MSRANERPDVSVSDAKRQKSPPRGYSPVVRSDIPHHVTSLVADASRIAVLTGAGMSAESGVPTFRDAQSGLWKQYDVMHLATPEAWQADSALVWAWYQWRATLVRRSQPNAGHIALADWNSTAEITIVTQNVDDLHERAGSTVAAHVHGSLYEPRCSDCGQSADVDPQTELAQRMPPPHCTVCDGLVRPGVVWFGESLPTEPWDRALAAVAACDVLLVVGTSGVVYPAAGLPSVARAAGVPVVEINPTDTDLTDQVDYSWRATAATALPLLVAQR